MAGNVNGKILALIGSVIIAVMVAQVAPTIFSNLGNATLFASAPSWVSPILLLIAGAGMVFLLWRAMTD